MKLNVVSAWYLHVLSASACLLPSEMHGSKMAARGPGSSTSTNHQLASRQLGEPWCWPPDPTPGNFGMPVSTTNRFPCDKVPRGYGSVDSPPVISELMNLDEVRHGFEALVGRFEGVELFDAPFKTFENRTVWGARVGGGGNNASDPSAQSVLLQAAIHPRERGGTDALVYFISDLLWAREENRGLKYGSSVYSADDVKAALDLGIVVIPVVNPDGWVHDYSTNGCWRKNRNPASATPGDDETKGIDLNRNFDVMWDFGKYFSPDLWPASTNPNDNDFSGTGAFSEAETQNVRWALDEHPNVGWYVDVHSGGGVVLHGWCGDSVQARDPAMNWKNPAFDGQRGTIGEDLFDYQEYMDRADWDVLGLGTQRMAGAMNDADFDYSATSPYMGGQGFINFGPSSGCSIDHAYNRHLEDASKKKVFGFGVEFGKFNFDSECWFYPTEEMFNRHNKVLGAGFMELLMVAKRGA